MNLYHISQTQHGGYETYDSAVVAAETEQQARQTHPSQYGKFEETGYNDWASSPDKVTVRLIGVAVADTPAGVICASFNAG